MPKLRKHESFLLDLEPYPIPDRFLDDLLECHRMGQNCPADEDIGKLPLRTAVRRNIGNVFERLAGARQGAHNAYWAAFYLAYCGRSEAQLMLWRIQCAFQTQLTKAVAGLPICGSRILLRAYEALGADKIQWFRQCAGALAVARVSHALARIGGHLFMPHPLEDARDKIDLIYQRPDAEGGLCLQIKSDVTARETTSYIVTEETAAADPSGYLQRMLRGIHIFSGHNEGLWTPIVLNVGQRPYLNTMEVRECPEIEQGTRSALALA
jgi:hypothetical protein